ncbi:RND efflux system, outer membrane lipoprotein [Criblamydia sequanensis CRIB-18]|uniref:RND efflux system, outer membrane lipoprotein n=2 Tax=Candidatus Criblamydia sequanensis TaxID=340071 RepID=A0A090D263_9BACT|nr:RND efflux system, outer membrane lipoprotein [Criblamydia sequanensis CRIB-18]
MRINISSLFYLLFLAFFLTSCFPRSYCPPKCFEMPENWKEEEVDNDEAINLTWWDLFEDPVLSGYINEALAYNQDLKEAVARVKEFFGKMIVARAPLYPQVSFNGSATKQEISIASEFLSQDINPDVTPVASFERIFDTFQIYLSASYQLDIWGKLESHAKASFYDLLRENEVKRTVLITVVTSVASSYIHLRQLDEQVAIAMKTFESRKESFRLATLRFEGGLTSELEVKQSESEVESAEASLIALQIDQAREENLLSILIGRPPDHLQRGFRLSELSKPFDIPVGLPCELIRSRPDIRAAENALRVANLEVDVARLAFMPGFALTGLFGFESSQLKDLITAPARFWEYGIALIQPVFSGKELSGKLYEARSIFLETCFHYYQTILIGLKEVEDALVSHRKFIELTNVQKQRVKVLGEYLALARLRYEEGQTDYLNVLDAERQLFSAELEYVSAESNQFLSLINLYKALGGGWVIDAERKMLPLCN